MASPLPRNLAKTIGSFLSDDPQPAPAIKVQKFTTTAAMEVTAFLSTHPNEFYSMAEIAAATGMAISRINDGMYLLIRRGEAERLLPPTRRGGGQKYRWVERGE